MGNFPKASVLELITRKITFLAEKRTRWSMEKVVTVRPRRPLLMVLARDNRDGTMTAAMKMNKNIRFKGKKQGAHKAATKLSHKQLLGAGRKQLGNRIESFLKCHSPSETFSGYLFNTSSPHSQSPFLTFFLLSTL